MKTNVLKTASGEKKKRMIINKAISRFISNTQKIVQKVKPEAQILIRKKKPKDKTLKNLQEKVQSPKVSEAPSRVIHIPDYHEIRFSEIPDTSSSPEATDSEEFEEIHNDLEQNEYFVRARPEIRKVKANGRSTDRIHSTGNTSKNFRKNLKKLERLVPEKAFVDYQHEGVHYLPWPVSQSLENLTVTFSNIT